LSITRPGIRAKWAVLLVARTQECSIAVARDQDVRIADQKAPAMQVGVDCSRPLHDRVCDRQDLIRSTESVEGSQLGRCGLREQPAQDLESGDERDRKLP